MTKNDKAPKKPRKSRKKGDATPAKGDAQPPVEPPPPPPPPPAPPSKGDAAPEANAEGWIDGRLMLDGVKHVLAATPKAKEQPALAFVLLIGCELRATSDYVFNAVTFASPVCESAVKVTRGSVEEFAALLKGELDAAAVTGASVLVEAHGLVAKIHRSGSEDPRVHLFDRYESGPDAAFITMAAPLFGGHATFDLDALRDALVWKGSGSLDVFLAADGSLGWFDVSVGGTHVARTVVAARTRSLGIRQPTLPGMAPKGAAAPTTPGAPSGPTLVHQLGPGTGWVRIECNRSVVWDRLSASDLSPLTPYEIHEERGVVSWGPYPSWARRVGELVARLTLLGLEPREIASDPANLGVRTLDAGAVEPTKPLELGSGEHVDPGITDAEFEEGDGETDDGGE